MHMIIPFLKVFLMVSLAVSEDVLRGLDQLYTVVVQPAKQLRDRLLQSLLKPLEEAATGTHSTTAAAPPGFGGSRHHHTSAGCSSGGASAVGGGSSSTPAARSAAAQSPAAVQRCGDPELLEFCVRVAAELPYKRADEPLLVLRSCNDIIARRGEHVVAKLKASLKAAGCSTQEEDAESPQDMQVGETNS